MTGWWIRPRRYDLPLPMHVVQPVIPCCLFCGSNHRVRSATGADAWWVPGELHEPRFCCDRCDVTWGGVRISSPI